MTTGLHLASSLRRRAAAAVAAAAVAAVGVLIALDGNASGEVPAAAAVVRAAAPVTTTAGGVSLTVNPATGLSAAGGALEVTGRGFKTVTGLYVAVCHADGKAPASLRDCVGGAIPTANTTAAWAHISSAGSSTAGPGQIAAKWGAGGTFSVELTLPPSDPGSDALDCSNVACALYTVPDSGQDSTQNLSVPLAYEAATPASSAAAGSSTTTTPTSSAIVTSQQESTSTVANAATTVSPRSIKASSVVAGGVQEVVFGGFAGNEFVSVMLYSAPIPLPAAKADPNGGVRIDFTVPVTLAAGTHLLRVQGQTSRITGIATFQVTAPVVSSPVGSSLIASTAADSTAASSSAVIAPPVSLSSSAAGSSAPTSAIAPVTPPAAPGSRPVWPWYVLGVIVLLWLGFALFMLQRRRTRLAAELQEKNRLLVEGAADEQRRAAAAVAAANADAPTAYLGPRPGDPAVGGDAGYHPGEPAAGGYTGYHPGDHGLLSGRDDPENPGLLSGQGYRPESSADRPTTYLPPASATRPPAEPNASRIYDGPQTGAWTPDFSSQPAAGGAAPATGARTPDFTSQPAAGPATGAWTPDFTEQRPPVAPAGGPTTSPLPAADRSPDDTDRPTPDDDSSEGSPANR